LPEQNNMLRIWCGWQTDKRGGWSRKGGFYKSEPDRRTPMPSPKNGGGWDREGYRLRFCPDKLNRRSMGVEKAKEKFEGKKDWPRAHWTGR